MTWHQMVGNPRGISQDFRIPRHAELGWGIHTEEGSGVWAGEGLSRHCWCQLSPCPSHILSPCPHAMPPLLCTPSGSWLPALLPSSMALFGHCTRGCRQGRGPGQPSLRRDRSCCISTRPSASLVMTLRAFPGSLKIPRGWSSSSPRRMGSLLAHPHSPAWASWQHPLGTYWLCPFPPLGEPRKTVPSHLFACSLLLDETFHLLEPATHSQSLGRSLAHLQGSCDGKGEPACEWLETCFGVVSQILAVDHPESPARKHRLMIDCKRQVPVLPAL